MAHFHVARPAVLQTPSHEAPSPLIRRWLKFVAASLQDPPRCRIHLLAGSTIVLPAIYSYCSIMLPSIYFFGIMAPTLLPCVLPCIITQCIACYNVVLHILLLPSAYCMPPPFFKQHSAPNPNAFVTPHFPPSIYCIKI